MIVGKCTIHLAYDSVHAHFMRALHCRPVGSMQCQLSHARDGMIGSFAAAKNADMLLHVILVSRAPA